MKIHFLGTSHGIAERDRFTSSIAVQVAERVYVIDAGAPIMKLLLDKNFTPADVAGIFITHSHCDHYLGLVEFMNQVECFREFEGVKIKVYAPELFPFKKMREFLFGEETEGVFIPPKTGGSRRKDDGEGQRVGCEFYSSGEIFNDGNVRISAIKTMHMADSHAFLFEAEGKRVLFTGDLRPDLTDFPEIAFSEKLDLVVTEAAHPMINADNTINTFSKVLSERLVITHVCPFRNTPEVFSEAKAKLDSRSITPVTDGDIIEL